MSEALWVAVDVGNSAIKVIAVDRQQHVPSDAWIDAAPQQTFSLLGLDWPQQVTAWVQSQRDRTASEASVCWWVSTVNHAASDPLRTACSRAASQVGSDFQWHQFEWQDVPMTIDVDAPERLGIDRLIGAYAAINRIPGPLVVVDAGSAVTIDWVRRAAVNSRQTSPEDEPEGVFCGGAIFPGLALQTAALSSGTEGLRQPAAGAFPLAALDRHKTLSPGRNTGDAIRVGVIAAVVGAIERLAEDYPQCPRDAASEISPAVVVSGGDSALISDHLRLQHVQIPHLVCRGLLDLAVKRCRSTAGGLK